MTYVARRGEVWQGAVWLGWPGLGPVRQGMAWTGGTP